LVELRDRALAVAANNDDNPGVLSTTWCLSLCGVSGKRVRSADIGEIGPAGRHIRPTCIHSLIKRESEVYGEPGRSKTNQ
jgi:hypothetical protein